MTANDIVKIAKTQIGVVEKGGKDGKSGNIVAYWDWWKTQTGKNDQGSSWCACFVSWVFAQAKASSLVAAETPAGFIYCPAGLNYFKKRNQLVEPSTSQPGDIIFFDWASDGVADHVGIVVENHLTYLITIEGNTSPEGAIGASQSNGGGVYQRKRYFGKTIAGIARPSYPVATSTK